ncbi:hypothetical protein [Levilactobacillus spicheri]|nr:hypothetical protein [Levilactobacillus spicheri]
MDCWVEVGDANQRFTPASKPAEVGTTPEPRSASLQSSALI